MGATVVVGTVGADGAGGADDAASPPTSGVGEDATAVSTLVMHRDPEKSTSGTPITTEIQARAAASEAVEAANKQVYDMSVHIDAGATRAWCNPLPCCIVPCWPRQVGEVAFGAAFCGSLCEASLCTYHAQSMPEFRFLHCQSSLLQPSKEPEDFLAHHCLSIKCMGLVPCCTCHLSNDSRAKKQKREMKLLSAGQRVRDSEQELADHDMRLVQMWYQELIHGECAHSQLNGFLHGRDFSRKVRAGDRQKSLDWHGDFCSWLRAHGGSKPPSCEVFEATLAAFALAHPELLARQDGTNKFKQGGGLGLFWVPRSTAADSDSD